MSLLRNCVRELVAARILIGNRRVTFLFIYTKPGLRDSDDGQGTTKQLQLAGADVLLIAEDFKARHIAWRYPTDIRRGDRLLQAVTTIAFDLLNSPDSPPRNTQYTRLSGTTRTSRGL